MSFALVACGGGSGSSEDSEERAGKYPVEISAAQFPTRQRLAQTSDLTIGVTNSGEKTLPAMAVTISLAGEAGESSILPFSVRSSQVGLALPDRPVWVLEEGYPKLAGEDGPGGAETANKKTFDFGPLKAGESRTAVWRVTPVRAGDYTLTYRIDAGLGGKAKAVTSAGNAPEGSFVVNITDVPPRTRVNDQGQVVEIGPGDSSSGSAAG